MKYSDFLKNIRENSPLIHHITNYVTVNDCANVTLAIGASPIMTANDDEFEDIANISSALVLNIGTMDKTDICRDKGQCIRDYVHRRNGS